MARQVRCTNCSRIVEPVVSVDIDGVLGDYHGHFVSFASDYLDKSLPEGYNGAYEFNEYLNIEKRTYRDIKLAYRQGGQKRMLPIYHGASMFMHALKAEVGAEVWIATTRPYLRLDNIDPDTQAWLERHNIPHDHMIYGDHQDDKYEQLVRQVDRERIIGVIDDLYEQLVRADRHIQRDVTMQPVRLHNQGAPWRNRFAEWDDALVVLQQRADEWREAHDELRAV